jgi:glycosyltransferase involved in cell wall biosynthesis
MPVYNAERYLREAIDSILSQSFADFEFLIVNDGSTDAGVEIIESYADPRIRLVHNDGNLGVVASLNRGLELSRGEFVARMDADDISRPARLARQVRFMEENPNVGVCGSWVRFFPGKYVWKLPATSEAIRCRQFSMAGVAHPSVMMRRELFARHALFYDPAFLHLEDYELWDRALKYMDFANIQEVLLDYRISPGQVSSRHRDDQLAAVAPLRLQKVRELGIEPTVSQRQLHEQVMNCQLPKQREALDQAEQWLLELQATNRKAGVYHERYFAQWLLQNWFSTCLGIGDESVCSFGRCLRSPLWSACKASSSELLRAMGAWVARREFWRWRRKGRV